ncbi:MAG: thermonuclease family protein [Clostridia bacterium]|nr:thermonuclease family protein [Clostridia bacterium]
MKKKLLALLLLVCIACGAFSACADLLGGNISSPASSQSTEDTNADSSSTTSESSSSSSTEDEVPPAIEEVDYAGLVAENFDLSSKETKKLEVSVKLFIDGDTTHFNVPTSVVANGVLKARYLAVDTPESTGKVQEWGKTAANFTKSKLQSATSIVLETDGADWEVDSTGERRLVWVWYKPEGSSTYRNLNIEILQNGLAHASNSAGNRYGEAYCMPAINQAKALKLHVYSNEKDPGFYYGDAVYLSLRELRLHVEEYDGVKVAYEGVITYNSDNGVYVESYDEETGIWYGMYAYYGFQMPGTALEILKPGKHVRIVGTVSEFSGSWQVSGLDYDRRNPDNPNSLKLLDEEEHAPVNLETTLERFNSNVTVEVDVEGEELPITKTYPYAQLALHSSIEMKNLVVTKVYTTNNGGDNDGAISITCKQGDKTIVVRTNVMHDEDGKLIKQDIFVGKTIDVKGIINYFQLNDETEGSYQINVFGMDYITIHN